MIRVTIDFLCVDPFAYDPLVTLSQSITTNPQNFNITNSGNAVAKPIFTITANQNIPALTFLNTTNSQTFTISGIVSTNVVVVDAYNMPVTLNGLNYYKVFSGSFIMLASGVNTLQVSGTTNATVQTTFANTYYGI